MCVCDRVCELRERAKCNWNEIVMCARVCTGEYTNYYLRRFFIIFKYLCNHNEEHIIFRNTFAQSGGIMRNRMKLIIESQKFSQIFRGKQCPNAPKPPFLLG